MTLSRDTIEYAVTFFAAMGTICGFLFAGYRMLLTGLTKVIQSKQQPILDAIGIAAAEARDYKPPEKPILDQLTAIEKHLAGVNGNVAALHKQVNVEVLQRLAHTEGRLGMALGSDPSRHDPEKGC